MLNGRTWQKTLKHYCRSATKCGQRSTHLNLLSDVWFTGEVVLSLASLVLGWYGEQKKQQAADIHARDMAARQKRKRCSEKRGGSALRMIVALVIICVSFGGLLLAQHSGVGVSQIFTKEPWLNLFGLVKLGGGKEVITATGFVLPEYVKYSVLSIVHFLFEMAAGKR